MTIVAKESADSLATIVKIASKVISQAGLREGVVNVEGECFAGSDAEVYIWLVAGDSVIGPENGFGHRTVADGTDTSVAVLRKHKGIWTSCKALSGLVQIACENRFSLLKVAGETDAAISETDF